MYFIFICRDKRDSCFYSLIDFRRLYCDNWKMPIFGKCFFTGTAGIKIPARESGSSQKLASSPPYKRVRALRLFDSPTTPKTLIEKSVLHTPLPSRHARLFSLEKPRPCSYQTKPEKPAANVNPFTPSGMLLTARKRTRSKRNLNR